MHETLLLTFFIYRPSTLIKSNLKSKICILNWRRLTLFSSRLASFFIVWQSWSLDYTVFQDFLNVNVFIHYGWFKHCCLNGAMHGLKVTRTSSVACIAACLHSKHCSTIFWSNKKICQIKTFHQSIPVRFIFYLSQNVSDFKSNKSNRMQQSPDSFQFSKAWTRHCVATKNVLI